MRVTYEAGKTERIIGVPAYQPLGKIEHKRAVARRQRTTYCHDFINVFEDALEMAWATHPPQIGAPSISTAGESLANTATDSQQWPYRREKHWCPPLDCSACKRGRICLTRVLCMGLPVFVIRNTERSACRLAEHMLLP